MLVRRSLICLRSDPQIARITKFGDEPDEAGFEKVEGAATY